MTGLDDAACQAEPSCDHRPSPAGVQLIEFLGALPGTALPYGTHIQTGMDMSYRGPIAPGYLSVLVDASGLYFRPTSDNYYAGRMRSRTVDKVVHSYYDSAFRDDSGLPSDPSSQVHMFVPHADGSTGSMLSYRGPNPGSDEGYFDDLARAVTNGAITSIDDIRQLQGERPIMQVQFYGAAYHVDDWTPDPPFATIADGQDVMGTLRTDCSRPASSPGVPGCASVSKRYAHPHLAGHRWEKITVRTRVENPHRTAQRKQSAALACDV